MRTRMKFSVAAGAVILLQVGCSHAPSSRTIASAGVQFCGMDQCSVTVLVKPPSIGNRCAASVFMDELYVVSNPLGASIAPAARPQVMITWQLFKVDPLHDSGQYEFDRTNGIFIDPRTDPPPPQIFDRRRVPGRDDQFEGKFRNKKPHHGTSAIEYGLKVWRLDTPNIGQRQECDQRDPRITNDAS